MAHEGNTDSLSKYFFSNHTVQPDLKEEIAAIKWFWPYDKMINLIKAEPPIYIIPFECKTPTKQELLARSMVAYDFFYKEEMIFYKEVYRDGTEKIDFCTPYAFLAQFLPQEK
jgi:hypothetical protein